MKISETVAVVTGGGTGIGAGITRALVAAGATVIACQPSAASAERARAELDAAKDARIAVVAHDLSQPSGCRALVDEVASTYGIPGILVNNAGITGQAAVGSFLDFDDDRLDQLLQVNLAAVFRLSRDFGRLMRERGEGGVIVSISSVAAFAAQQQAAAYAASKAALIGLNRAMAVELAPFGIRCVTVVPGDIQTDADTGSSRSPQQPSSAPAPGWGRSTSLGRRGTPADIGEAVLFACSDSASFITGSSLVVDGGWLA